ncbi:hypothetical protein F4811DRAFT_567043 [Daldinia bambusicola]|nr:hypothetical protein F4811DRAFT_567043 [Daldinia bambusicola]
MAKLVFPLGLVSILFCLLLPTVQVVSAVSLTEIFVVQDGSNKGGCDTYFDQVTNTGTLDAWHEEIIYSLTDAINNLDKSYSKDVKIQQAIRTFFGISSKDKNVKTKVKKIIDNLRKVHDFFNVNKVTRGPAKGDPIYGSNKNRYLFCGSDFLEEERGDSVARDWQDKEIMDSKGNPVTIEKVPGYKKALKADPGIKPWWSGGIKEPKGYYFSTTGKNYCNKNTKNLALTAAIKVFTGTPPGLTRMRRTVDMIVLCGESFTNTISPNSYNLGNAKTTPGTSLADVLPKSATLLHEAFHLIFGVYDGKNSNMGFLEGDDEKYDLAACIQLAREHPIKARMNPENYVFFVTQMYYLFGKSSGSNEPADIVRNWNFKAIKQGSNYVYGAVNP